MSASKKSVRTEASEYFANHQHLENLSVVEAGFPTEIQSSDYKNRMISKRKCPNYSIVCTCKLKKLR